MVWCKTMSVQSVKSFHSRDNSEATRSPQGLQYMRCAYIGSSWGWWNGSWLVGLCVAAELTSGCWTLNSLSVYADLSGCLQEDLGAASATSGAGCSSAVYHLQTINESPSELSDNCSSVQFLKIRSIHKNKLVCTLHKSISWNKWS
jgi:hypothetical protein